MDKTHTDPDIPTLVAANGSQIASYVFWTISFKFMGHCFKWRFILADVRQPLLGVDFLANYKLFIDVARKRLIDTESCVFSLLVRAGQQSVNEFSPRTTGPYAHLFERFPEVFRAELKQTHGIVYHIKTNGPPVHSRFQRLTSGKMRRAKEYLAEMEKMGICSKAARLWSSPLHMVPKPDGIYRSCDDYSRLNLQTEPDPTPNIIDITGNLYGSKVFSKLDLLKRYFKVPENCNHNYVTSSTILLFFVKFWCNISKDDRYHIRTYYFCIVYVLVFSKFHAEHEGHLKCVLNLLRENGLVMRPNKCIFGPSSIKFLGHVIDESGIQPSATKGDAIRRLPTPQTVKDV